MCVDNADERFAILPIVAQLRQPVEVVRRTDGFAVQLGDNITSMDVDDDQSAESDSVVLRQRSTHQVDDVSQLRLRHASK